MGAPLRIGVDVEPQRLELALSLGAIDIAVRADDDAAAAVRDATDGHGCDVSVDASGSVQGRRTAVLGTRHHGRCVLVGEGGRLELDVSPALIHPAITLYGSWVTSLGRMEELVDNLVRWELHPETTVTDRFGLEQAGAAYALADSGRGGKVAITMS
jgi:threonine dehydrogenase-like Zn-dependent dehydrogenase